MTKTMKIFVNLRGEDARKKGEEAIKRLIKIAYDRGESAAQEKRPLPPTFIDFFGKEIDFRNFDKMEAKDLMRGSVLKKRERILLDFVKKASGISIESSSIINESMLFDINGIISINKDIIKNKN